MKPAPRKFTAVRKKTAKRSRKKRFPVLPILVCCLLGAAYGVYAYVSGDERVERQAQSGANGAVRPLPTTSVFIPKPIERQTPVGVNEIAKLFPSPDVSNREDGSDVCEKKTTAWSASGFPEPYKSTPRDAAAEKLLEQAKAAGEVAEKARLFEAIINQYTDNSDEQYIGPVTEAMLWKAEYLDRDERVSLYDKLIGRYESHTKYPATRAVDKTYERWIALVHTSAERLSLSDRRIRWLMRINEPRRLIATLRDKAELLESPEEKKALYSAVYADYGGSKNGDLVYQIAMILNDWVEITENTDEKVWLYDAIVEECKYGIGFTSGDAENAIRAKAEILGNKSLVRRFWQQEMRRAAENADEYRAASELFRVARNASALADVRSGLDQVIARYSRSGNAEAVAVAASAMIHKAGLEFNLEKRNALYDEVVDTFKSHGDKTVLVHVGRALEAKVWIEPDLGKARALCDQMLATARANGLSGALAEKMKSELSGESTDEGRFDEKRIAEYGKDTSSNLYTNALFDKAKMLHDVEEKIALLDKTIALSRGRGRPDKDSGLTEAFLYRIDLAGDRDEKNALCDRLLALYSSPLSISSEFSLLKALKKKKEVSGDDALLVEFYDRRVEKERNEIKRLSLRIRKARDCGDESGLAKLQGEAEELYQENPEWKALECLATSITTQADFAEGDEKIVALYDAALERVGQHAGEVRNLPLIIMLQKLNAVSDRTLRLTLCDELIAKSVAMAEETEKNYLDYLRYAHLALERKTKLLRGNESAARR